MAPSAAISVLLGLMGIDGCGKRGRPGNENSAWSGFRDEDDECCGSAIREINM
jgi:hypothetical protein